MLLSKDDKREKISKSLSDIKRSDLGKEFARLQRQLLKTKKSMLVIVDGWESSGKGYLLKDLIREMEPKYYNVAAFGKYRDHENSRHFLYRYLKEIPRYGQISFFDRSFYYDLFSDYGISKGDLKAKVEHINNFEKMLKNDDTLVVKLFLHQTEEEMDENIKELEKEEFDSVRLSVRDYDQLKDYAKYLEHFNYILKETNINPWDILYVEGKKDTSRKALQICIDKLTEHLDSYLVREKVDYKTLAKTDTNWPLNKVDLSKTIEDDEYDEILEKLQEKAGDLLYQAYIEGKKIIVAYEGTDASGKGGNIARLTRQMDPRGYDVVSIGSPSEEELNHHYLWRFNEALPTDGRMTIFDRSWYGRVLVERVDYLTRKYRWMEAYQEINDFERYLVDEDYLVLKYLIIIDHEEQAKRFEERRTDPDKQYKYLPSDIKAHEQYDDYFKAMNEMIINTDTSHAPWKIISGQQKKNARIEVLNDFVDKVSSYLDKK